MDLFKKGSIFHNLSSIHGVSILAAVVFFIILMIVLANILHINILTISSTLGKKLIAVLGKAINKKEKRYHRDIAIGKVTEKRMQVKMYRFINDLIIDLGLKRKGANPYEFLFLMIILSTIISIVFCQLIFRNFVMGIMLMPVVFAAIICGLYTKANIAHDQRIESIIEAENIISNSIKDGVVVAVRNTLDVMPPAVRTEFRDFLDNVTHKNYHIRTALLELNNNLGSTADDFIKKCIVFELEEEHGIIGMFKDIVAINNIKTEMRTEMKRKFEEVTTEFVIGALMIFVFLGGTMAIFPTVANFYFKTIIGQIIIALDLLIVVGEFVYITYLRAKEL